MTVANSVESSRAICRNRQARIKTNVLPHTNSLNLDEQADEMLSPFMTRGSGSGIYSQAALDRKMRNEQKRLPMLVERGISNDMLDCLADRQVEDIIDAAGLTAVEEIIYRLYVSGFSGKRIASALKIKRRTIYSRLRTVRRKVRAAYNEGIYAGWYEVYLSEVNRGR